MILMKKIAKMIQKDLKRKANSDAYDKVQVFKDNLGRIMTSDKANEFEQTMLQEMNQDELNALLSQTWCEGYNNADEEEGCDLLSIWDELKNGEINYAQIFLQPTRPMLDALNNLK